MISLCRGKDIRWEEAGAQPFFGWGVSKVRVGCNLLLSLSDLLVFTPISGFRFLLLKPTRTRATENHDTDVFTYVLGQMKTRKGRDYNLKVVHIKSYISSVSIIPRDGVKFWNRHLRMTLLTSVLVFYSHAQTNRSLTGFQRHAQWGDSYLSLVSKFPFQIFLASYPGHCTVATPKVAANSPFQDDFSNFRACRVCRVVTFFPSLHGKVLVKAQGWDKFRRAHKQMRCSSEHIYTPLQLTNKCNDCKWSCVEEEDRLDYSLRGSIIVDRGFCPTGYLYIATPPAAVQSQINTQRSALIIKWLA